MCAGIILSGCPWLFLPFLDIPPAVLGPVLGSPVQGTCGDAGLSLEEVSRWSGAAGWEMQRDSYQPGDEKVKRFYWCLHSSDLRV